MCVVFAASAFCCFLHILFFNTVFFRLQTFCWCSEIGNEFLCHFYVSWNKLCVLPVYFTGTFIISHSWFWHVTAAELTYLFFFFQCHMLCMRCFCTSSSILFRWKSEHVCISSGSINIFMYDEKVFCMNTRFLVGYKFSLPIWSKLKHKIEFNRHNLLFSKHFIHLCFVNHICGWVCNISCCYVVIACIPRECL